MVQTIVAAQVPDVLTPQDPIAVLPALPAPRALPAPPPQRAQPAQPAQPAIAAMPPAPAKIATTAQPAADVWSTQQSLRDLAFSDGFQIASFLLVFPFAIALARRVWVRGGRRTTVVDLENSPRLQRIEQAVESIALEVERIGEGQRFTTKLLAERESVASRIPPSASPARREPGTITPH